MDKIITIFICEQGDLEIKTALLAASLRSVFSDKIELICGIPIYAKKRSHPNELTLQFLESLGTKIHSFKNPLITEKNISDPGILYSNKLFCFPENLDHERIIFLDSDILCLRKPLQLLNTKSNFMTCQDFRILDLDWPELYMRCDIPESKLRVKSFTDGKIGYPYFNSGFFFLNDFKPQILVNAWRTIFCQLREILTNQQHLIHSDQISLTLAVQKMRITYEIMPVEYNFPSGNHKISDLPYFAHYHGPEKISKDAILHTYVMELIQKYSELKNIASRFPFWKEMMADNISSKLLNMAYFLKKQLGSKIQNEV